MDMVGKGGVEAQRAFARGVLGGKRLRNTDL